VTVLLKAAVSILHVEIIEEGMCPLSPESTTGLF